MPGRCQEGIDFSSWRRGKRGEEKFPSSCEGSVKAPMEFREEIERYSCNGLNFVL